MAIDFFDLNDCINHTDAMTRSINILHRDGGVKTVTVRTSPLRVVTKTTCYLRGLIRSKTT